MSALLKNKILDIYKRNRDLKKIPEKYLHIVDSIIAGIMNDEFIVFLQPQVGIKTRCILCGEALVRWQCDDGSLMMPDDFIPILEETQMVYLFDCYMLDKVCKEISSQIIKGFNIKPISVNQSALNLDNDDYFDNFIGIVDKYNIPHSYLVFELTETVFVEKNEKIQRFVKRLNEEGFVLAIDDFGVGYSNANILTKVKADVLKIDRSLIEGICSNRRSKIIVKKIIEMAHEMKMIVISEGVETLEQLELLEEMNCDIAQGYYFSKAVSIEAFEQLCDRYEDIGGCKDA